MFQVESHKQIHSLFCQHSALTIKKKTYEMGPFNWQAGAINPIWLSVMAEEPSSNWIAYDSFVPLC